MKYPIDRRFGNAIVAYVRYLVKTVWPTDLAAFYPYPRSLSLGIVAGAALLLAGITLAALLLARSHPYLTTGWLWYVGTLVPVIGLVQVGMQSMADRYSYIPLIGIFIAVVWAAGEIRKRLGIPAAVPAAAGVLALAAFSVAASRQTAVWKNTITLFEHALTVTTDNPVAHNVLANFLAKQGRLDEAIPHFEEASRIQPDYETSDHWGLALAIKGRFDEAIDRFREALRLKPDQLETRVRLAEVLQRQGRTAEAIDEYAVAIKARPEDVRVRTNFAAALADAGRDRRSPSTRRRPDRSRIRRGAQQPRRRARVERAHPRCDRSYEFAVRLKPEFADARFNLGGALLAAGEEGKAAAALPRAAQDRSDYPGARQMLEQAEAQASIGTRR